MNKKILLFFLFPICMFALDKPNSLPTSADLFHHFGHNLMQSFSNEFGIYHVAAAGLSYGLVKSGADWQYYSFMEKNKILPRIGFASVITGGLVPLTVPFYLYFKGKSGKDAKLMYTALALGQSVMQGLLITSSYKAITGREPPETLDAEKGRRDYSDQFNFGFMRRGIFDGWPSGHTTNAFAMSVVLWEMYPENTKLKIYSGIYAFMIGLGVSTNIHWFSDFVAGALIGYSIGKSVGHSFKNLADGNAHENTTHFHFTPNGFRFTIRF